MRGNPAGVMTVPRVPYGVARARTFHTHGVTRGQLRRLVEQGAVRHLRHGWYQTDDADPDVVRAIRLGARLSCLTVLGRSGLWLPPWAGLHIRLPERSRRSGRRPVPADLHTCTPYGPQSLKDFGAVDPISLALSAAARCTTAEYFVAILDSALRSGQWSLDDLTHVLQHCPGHLRQLLTRTGRADSGTESLVRFRLESCNIAVTPQVEIPSVGRVDLLVGRRLVIEVDSVAHHTGLEAYTRDRERDRTLAALGYERIRLTWQQVIHDWDRVFADIVAIIRRGDHLRTPRLH